MCHLTPGYVWQRSQMGIIGCSQCTMSTKMFCHSVLVFATLLLAKFFPFSCYVINNESVSLTTISSRNNVRTLGREMADQALWEDRKQKWQKFEKFYRAGEEDGKERSTTQPSPGGSIFSLYAKDCTLKLVVDHTFFNGIGGGDAGIASSSVTNLVRSVDTMFRVLDLDSNKLPNQIGFRIENVVIYDDSDDYPLRSETLSSDEVLKRASEFSGKGFCYVLVFTQRSFLDDTISKSYSWSARGSDKLGGVCGGEEHPNAGFVTMERRGQPLSPCAATTAVARALVMAFGATEDCSGKPAHVSVLGASRTQHMPGCSVSISQCSVTSIARTLSEHSACLVSVFPESGEDYDYDGNYYGVSDCAQVGLQLHIIVAFMLGTSMLVI